MPTSVDTSRMDDIHVTFTKDEASAARYAILHHCDTLERAMAEIDLDADWLEVFRKLIECYQDAAVAIANGIAAAPIASRKA